MVEQSCKLTTLINLSIIILGMSCAEVINPTLPAGEGRVKGYIHGVITDARDNSPLTGVKVSYITSDSAMSVTSNASGFYSIPELAEGNYELIYEFEGYATMISPVSVSDPMGNFDELDEQDFTVSITKSIEMFKEDATVTGTIYAFKDVENTVPAEGATVILDVDPNSFLDIMSSQLTATTDTKGAFRFENVPSVGSAFWRILPYSNGGFTYQTSGEFISIIEGSEVSVGDIVLAIVGSAPLVIANNFESDEFLVGNNLSLMLSKTIDPATVNVSLSGPFGSVGIEWSWDASNTLLTIDPNVTLRHESFYNLQVNGRSADGIDFVYFFSFMTESGIRVISINLQQLDGQTNDFAITKNIIVSFSRAADPSDSNVRLYTLTGIDSLAATLKWTEGGTKATLNPAFNLDSTTTYSFRLEPVSSTLENDQLFQTFIFSTE
ncbi:MAG: carboxypeptidase regulatory-like domain-containing protein [Candidatus Marinimicrobia bacterium]|nr:carboxypeptidase regulatory-like domain-containing protein [Candidatus Neomarinimicrobiota bacterium]